MRKFYDPDGGARGAASAPAGSAGQRQIALPHPELISRSTLAQPRSMVVELPAAISRLLFPRSATEADDVVVRARLRKGARRGAPFLLADTPGIRTQCDDLLDPKAPLLMWPRFSQRCTRAHEYKIASDWAARRAAWDDEVCT